jgi:tripartite-type tricarboxylate transporter receptor subunit TctC
MRKLTIVLLALAIASPALFAAGQQDSTAAKYPAKPVQIIVPFGPGGGTDVFVRTMMKYLKMPQPMVAVNVEGSSGFIGVMQAYNAPNDGYNILASSPVDIMSYTLSGLTKETMYANFEPICFVVSDYDMVSTNKQSGFKSIQDVVAYAKANPGKIRWGTTGSKTACMVNTMWICENLGLTTSGPNPDVILVPYDGGGQARPAILGNHVQVLSGSYGDVKSSVASGDVLPLMVINDKRVRLMPNTPTTLESGCETTTFIPRGIFAPKGTSIDQIRYLEAAIKAVTEDPAFKNEIENLGIDVRFVPRDTAQGLIKQWYGAFEPRFKRLP